MRYSPYFTFPALLRFHPPAMACALLWLACGGILAQNDGKNGPPNTPAVAKTKPPAPDVRFEFFGAERGYAVGTESVTFLCVVRNVGNAPLPENTLRLRVSPVAGLDYTSGETLPPLPALASNQALAFRWRLAPTDAKGPLVAAVLIERLASAAPPPSGSSPTQGAVVVTTAGTNSASLSAPNFALAAVPRFPTPPRIGTMSAGAAPAAGATGERAWVGNDRVGAQLLASERRHPVLLLVRRDAQEWRALATGTPLVQVLSGEDGQKPWRETFRWHDSRVQRNQDSATLTLLGAFGSRWRAELALTAQRDTAALKGTLRLTSRRTMRLYGVQFPRLLAPGDTKDETPPKADGSAVSLTDTPSPLPENARVAAALTSGFTFGLTWPSTAPLPGWRSVPLPEGDAKRVRVLSAQSESDARGVAFPKGTSVEFTFRLFAFGPSGTVRDALRFALP